MFHLNIKAILSQCKNKTLHSLPLYIKQFYVEEKKNKNVTTFSSLWTFEEEKIMACRFSPFSQLFFFLDFEIMFSKIFWCVFQFRVLLCTLYHKRKWIQSNIRICSGYCMYTHMNNSERRFEGFRKFCVKSFIFT